MKKIVFIIVLMCLAIASSLSTNAQVNYSVTFSWDDSNCSCNEPVTKEARVYVYEYPSGNLVKDSKWFSISGSPHTYQGDATGLRDCDDEYPCYTVYVVVRYTDNTGECCIGSEIENTTGAWLFSGYFSMANTIIMN